MVEFTDDASGLGIPHLGSGFNDIVAFIFDSPRETSIDATAADVLAKNIFILDFSEIRTTLNQFFLVVKKYSHIQESRKRNKSNRKTVG